jgi:hypothetical protein
MNDGRESIARMGCAVALRLSKTPFYFNWLYPKINEKIRTFQGLDARTALPKAAEIQHGAIVRPQSPVTAVARSDIRLGHG